MPISAPPTIPQITDPSTFATRAQDWVVWQANDFYPGITDIAGLSGLPSSATSTTSNTIGTGSKSFTVETGRGFIAGQSLSIAYTTTPTNRMFAVVTSYNSGTGALVVNVQAIEGSGTFTAWSIAIAFNGNVKNAQLNADVFSTARTWTGAQSFTANTLVTGAALLGYGTGAGGSILQLTSKSTAVTINKPTGAIATATTSLGAAAAATFVVNNSLCNNNSLVIATIQGSANYEVLPYFVTSGQFGIRLTNVSAGALGESVTINFALISGVNG